MKRQLYEGSGTILFEGPIPGTMIRQFTQTKTVNKAAAPTEGYAALRNRISELLMSRLHEVDIPTQFVRRMNMREQLIHQVDIFPLRFVVRNYASEEFAGRFELPNGMKLPRPLLEIYYATPEAPVSSLVSEEHITAFGWASPADYDTMVALSLRAHDFLAGQFLAHGLRLVDLSLDFGLLSRDALLDTQVVIASDMGPASWTLFDLLHQKMLNLGDAGEEHEGPDDSLAEVARRLGILQEGGPIDLRPGLSVAEGPQESADIHTLKGRNSAHDA